ncbi:DUF6476 family protein [Sulfitobacter aestuariivivens]|uniref:Uncharacterized protein n=1 Tax=Sulfitobacter aestuariivivens TaxID=2766981 RepID=A0A927HDN9_9RHOB|nr:DUF6476 family protein [Sulfitobacter aestuariivivens]MBD3662543.1 hypothetical protein [Sulfitobacter aestuariivivens]
MENPVEPANLRFLRRLVTVLTAVMICGLLVIIGLFVTRLGPTQTVMPPNITLPDGTKASAYTVGSDWYAIVTTDDTILIYDRASGAVRQTITIE